MNLIDFRYMRQGQQLNDLKREDKGLLTSVRQHNKSHKNALLILHGFSSSPAVYRYLIPKIKQYDAVVCPILPGHAESINAFSQAKATQWQAIAQETCASLLDSYEQVDVLGLSLGGLLACELSILFPLHHLYLLAPALKLHMNVTLMLRITRFFHALGFAHIRNAAGNILNSEHAEISYRKLPLSIIIEMLQLVQNYQWTPPPCPTDLFLGAHDLVVDSHAVENFFHPLANVSIHWLENSAHVLPLDNDLEAIIQCVNS